MTIVLLGLAGYGLGSLPWGYWLTRHVTGSDIRQVGKQQHRRPSPAVTANASGPGA